MIIPTHFGGDRPISAGEDKLGYEEPAHHVAEAILRFSSREGFVLGLEGNWGSGKSSFVNLVISSLEQHDVAPEIVKFSPWLISSRVGLLEELFREIAQAAEKIDLADDSVEGGWFKRHLPRLPDHSAKRRRLSGRLRKFSEHLTRMGMLAKAADVFLPGAGPAGEAIRSAGSAATKWAAGSSLEDEKNKLTAELRRLKRQIVIFVDDLDRLEPTEAAEVVRLVRAVADFPNIVYVLCYSRKILAHSLNKALRLEDGASYIDKIVQVTFSVPKPEDFDLRRMFRNELDAVFPPEGTDVNSFEARQRQQRLASVIDIEGGRTLNTPRDVVRVLNALRLYAGPVADKIDLGDMVWLQLTRIGNPTLYAWVETYINAVAAVSGGAQIASDVSGIMAKTMAELLTANGGDIDTRIRELRRILPGISRRTLEAGSMDTPLELFHGLNTPDAFASYIVDKRLGSPQHFRFYFALSKPSGALEDSDYEAFLAAAERNPKEAMAIFDGWAREPRPQGGILAEGLMERLSDDVISKLPPGALPGIVLALAQAMDVAAHTLGTGEWGRVWIWDIADRIFKATLRNMPSATRSETIRTVFTTGKALGWLTNIMRGEIFAHGRFGAARKELQDRVFTSEELDWIIATLRARYRETDPAQLLDTPQLTNLLFGWLQTGQDGEAEVRAWVAERIQTDDGLLVFLDRSRSWLSVNGEVSYPIKRENLEPFTDYEAVRMRIEQLGAARDAHVRARAGVILDAMQEKD